MQRLLRMSDSQDIDHVLRDWPYQAGTVSARLVRAEDGREVLQMRIEMGVLQLETTGRPDGERPGGTETYLEFLTQQVAREDVPFTLSEEQCFEVDRELLQFYHRRICFLALREFGRAVRDADHTLALMDIATQYTPNPEWAQSHEQYRPFVLFHRTQAMAMVELEESGPEAAIEEITRGLESLRNVYTEMDAEEQFPDDQLVAQLIEIKESLRSEYHVGQTLGEQLADAVAAEQYERAARIRDEIARRRRQL
jgi:hypothetical protein